ncbi:MAG: hypothetical protein QM652_04130 [Legionella sp.]|uniref:hypothetical protein n=1 Tax=Legionella sp. TaxID=459 RepID=UPI0039E434EB
MIFLSEYEKSIKEIAAISSWYSIKLGRYTIKDPNKDISSQSKKKTSLEVLIGRVNKFIITDCDTVHVTARDVFSNITNQLRRQYLDVKCTPEDEATASLYLLGALIHRYLRIKESCNYSLSLFRWFSKPKNSDLYLGVCAALEVTKRALDDYTIYTGLSAFRMLMYADVEYEETIDATKTVVKKPKYKTFVHFNNDPNFQTHLDDLINSYKIRGAEVIFQFNAIYFIDSLAKQLEKDRIIFEEELKQWRKYLESQSKEFYQLNYLTIKKHINEYIQEKLDCIHRIGDPKENEKAQQQAYTYIVTKDKLLFLVGHIYETPEIWKKISNFPDFFDALKKANITNNRLILCGGYSLLLKSKEWLNDKSINSDVLHQIEESISLEESLTEEEHCDCTKKLRVYVESELPPVLNCDFFDGRGKMLTILTNVTSKLSQAMKEQREKERREKELQEKRAKEQHEIVPEPALALESPCTFR